MSNKTRQLIGQAVLILAAIATLYTLLVLIFAETEQLWAWFHQLAAAVIAVVVPAIFAIRLFLWQTEQTSATRRHEVRASLISVIFDHWDVLKDENLQKIQLPGGYEEEVLLTFLPPTAYDEAIRNSVFDGAETIAISRLLGLIHHYNDAVAHLLPLLESLTYADEDQLDGKPLLQLSAAIRDVNKKRELVMNGGADFMKLLSREELDQALEVADQALEVINTDRLQNTGPDVDSLIRDRRPQFKPVGFVPIYSHKIEKVLEARLAEDNETARSLLDELIKEVEDAANKKKITVDASKKLLADLKQLSRG